MDFDNLVGSKELDVRFEKNKLYNYLGKDLVRILKKYNVIVAGGMITSLFTNKEINDVDVYFRTEENIAGFIEEVWDEYIVSHTKKATLFVWREREVNIQAIHFKMFNNPKEVFKTFDFTHVMGAFDFKTEEFVFHKDFLKHNAQKILKFNKNTAFPLISLIRVGKYQDRGYKISKPELMRIVMTCMNLEIKTYDELKEQLGGMYGENLDKLFPDSEEFSLDKAIDVLQDLSVGEDYFKKPVPVHFNDADDLIASICNIPVKWFKLGEERYRIRYDGGIEDFSYGYNLPDNAVQVDPKDYADFRKVYKFVRKSSDGELSSFWDSSFSYRIGEEIKTDNPQGLFFNRLEDIERATYRTYDKAVAIEVEVDFDDLIAIDGYHLRYNKCKVLREIPKEEYEKYLKAKEDANLPF